MEQMLDRIAPRRHAGLVLRDRWRARVELAIGPTIGAAHRNRRISALYAHWYLAHREIFKWAGIAAFASQQVGSGLSLAGIARSVLARIRDAVLWFVRSLWGLLMGSRSTGRAAPPWGNHERLRAALAPMARLIPFLGLRTTPEAQQAGSANPMNWIALLRETNDAVMADIGWALLFYAEQVAPALTGPRKPPAGLARLGEALQAGLQKLLPPRAVPDAARAAARWEELRQALQAHGAERWGDAESNLLLEGFAAIYEGHRALAAGATDARAVTRPIWRGNFLLLIHEQLRIVQPTLFDRAGPAFERLLAIFTYLDFDADPQAIDRKTVSFFPPLLGEGIDDRTTRLVWIAQELMPRWFTLDHGDNRSMLEAIEQIAADGEPFAGPDPERQQRQLAAAAARARKDLLPAILSRQQPRLEEARHAPASPA
ncbi:MAG: hypothetical protein OHK0015_49340 [Chloroflexi bacterium OHK40]